MSLLINKNMIKRKQINKTNNIELIAYFLYDKEMLNSKLVNSYYLYIKTNLKSILLTLICISNYIS